MRIVLITGAARGIGLATARRLAETNYRVYARVRQSSDTADLDALAREFSSNLTKLVVDVTLMPIFCPLNSGCQDSVNVFIP